MPGEHNSDSRPFSPQSMPSRKITIILVTATLVTGALACIQLANDDLGMFFGTPPRPPGTAVYENFESKDVHTVVLVSGQGKRAEFIKREGVWHMVYPATDRANQTFIKATLDFSRNLLVEDVLRRHEITTDDTGTGGDRYRVTLKDSAQKKLVDYQLGRHTAWHRPQGKDGRLAETFFVHPCGESARRHVYICSAAGKVTSSIRIRSLLDRDLERLRDHRPLLIDETAVAGITIRSQEREIVLNRPEADTQSWTMTKPIESRANPKMVNGLIKGLAQLNAVRIHDRNSTTIPPRPPGEFPQQLELRGLASDGTTISPASILTIEPPSSPEADTVLATTEQRPGLIFEIPRKPVRGSYSLAQLPLSVDQLRARTLTDLKIASLRSMTIHKSSNTRPLRIFLGRESRGRPRWMLETPNGQSPANETLIARVLKALTNDEALSFASNAASNLTRYGLSPPSKRLVMNLKDNEPVDLVFGRTGDGRCYAMHQGSSTVAEIDPRTYTSIAVEPYQWRDSLLMAFSIVDLSTMKIEQFPLTVPLTDPALTLKYKFLTEDWEARQFEEDVSPALNKHRANQFINFMETLRVEQWLHEETPAAARALLSPSYRFTAVFRELDDEGDLKGFRETSFDLAPASRSSRNRIIYGKISGNPNYFVLSMDSYRQLKARLLDNAGS